MADPKSRDDQTAESSFFQADDGGAGADAFLLDSHDLPATDLERIFYSGDCRALTKWPHYLEVYERYLSRFRGQDFRMLEIGVWQGGSLDMWRAYFGEAFTLFGIDINPNSADMVTPPNQIRIGSQSDTAFLQSLVDQMGGIDVVLDDGSHRGEDQRASFEFLFPLLSDNGIYIIEDLQASYWGGRFDGGFGKADTGVGFLQSLIDDLHGWFHDKAQIEFAKHWVYAVHLFDGIAVIEKRARKRPGHIIMAPNPEREKQFLGDAIRNKRRREAQGK